MRELIADFIACKSSLDNAVGQSGGSTLSLDELNCMTAIELIDLICSNQIRFRYEGPDIPQRGSIANTVSSSQRDPR